MNPIPSPPPVEKDITPLPENSSGEVPHEPEFADAVSEYMMEKFIDDPAERRKKLLAWEPSDFISTVKTISSLVRSGERSETEFDGQTVRIGALFDDDRAVYDAPPFEDRPLLLADAWNAAKTILSDASKNDKEALEHAGALLGSALILIHPFRDTNGRTGRILFGGVTMGAEQTNQHMDVLLSDNGSSFLNVAPVIEQSYVAARMIDELDKDPETAEELKDSAVLYAGSHYFSAHIYAHPHPSERVEIARQRLQDVPYNEEVKLFEAQMRTKFVQTFLEALQDNTTKFELPEAASDYMKRVGKDPLDAGFYALGEIHLAWIRNFSLGLAGKTKEEIMQSALGARATR